MGDWTPRLRGETNGAAAPLDHRSYREKAGRVLSGALRGCPELRITATIRPCHPRRPSSSRPPAAQDPRALDLEGGLRLAHRGAAVDRGGAGGGQWAGGARAGGFWVDLRRDQVELDGAPLQRAERLHLLLYKPKGYLTTYDDPQGRPTVFDLLPPGAPTSFRSAGSTSTPAACWCSPTTPPSPSTSPIPSTGCPRPTGSRLRNSFRTRISSRLREGPRAGRRADPAGRGRAAAQPRRPDRFRDHLARGPEPPGAADGRGARRQGDLSWSGWRSGRSRSASCRSASRGRSCRKRSER